MSVGEVAESEENLKFRTETLSRTENGVELGKHKSAIEGFMAKLLSNYFENDLSLIRREVEKAAEKEFLLTMKKRFTEPS